MPELSEQEKLERRREKRKQKILASAENRLNRITGTAFPNRVSPTPSPSTSTSSLARSDRRSPSPSPAVFMASSTSTDTLRSRKRPTSMDHGSAAAAAAAADPSDAVGAPPLSFLSTPPPPPFLEASMSTSSTSTSFMHQHYPPTAGSPLPPSLEAMLSGTGGGSNNEQQPLPNLNDLFGGQLPFNPAFLATLQQQQQQQQHQQETVPEQADQKKYWDLLHFVSMLWLGFYAVYTEWRIGGKERFASLLFSAHSDYPAVAFPLFWYFITVELLLQSARMVYQKGNAGSSSFILTAVMQYLPPQLANVVNVLMRYWIILSCLVKDVFVLVFIIGLAEIISAAMV